MLNPFFQQGSREEQSLIQDLINEQLRMYGVEIYYLPRQYVTEKTVIREVIESKFEIAHPIEAYVDNYEGYADNSTILTKFGIQATNEITLIISKERYDDYISPLIENKPNIKLSSRPKEGDLLYFPLGDRLFEIKYVEHEKPFYQLQKNYVYELRCELFRYEDEVIDTGVDEIDDVLTEIDGADGNEIFLGRTQTLTLVGSAATATAITSLRNGGIRFIAVTNRGGGYTSTPRVAISSAPNGGITGIATAIMIGGVVACNDNVNPLAKSVQSVQLINPGSGYTVAPKVRFIGGNGSGAAATSIIESGIIGIVTITSGGSGYSTAPTVTFSTPKHVGAAATAIIDTTVGTGGSVTDIIISQSGPYYLFTDTTGGRFYKPGFVPTVTVDLPSGSGNVAIATAIMSDYNSTGGRVSSIAITSEGKYYTSAPSVTISHPGFSFAAATIDNGGGIDGSSIDPNSLVFTNTGRAYTTAPIVAITTGPGQSVPTQVAVGVATIHPITGIVTAVGFDSSLPWCIGTGATVGSGYTTAPLISFSGSPSPVQATATAVVSIAGTISSISIGNSGYGYANGFIPTVTIAGPGGIGEQFRALGVATMRYNSVKTSGIIGIGSNFITGITTTGILKGDRVRLQYEYLNDHNIFPSINFISTTTYVSSIGYGTIFLSESATNVGVATTSFEFGIDQCGIVTGIAVTFGGGGYLTPPTVTIQNDPQIKNYIELIVGVNTAKGVAVVSSAGTITSIRVTDSGSNYVLPPTITIQTPASSGIGTFEFNEVVTGSVSGTTARVRKWSSITNELEVSNVSGEFIAGEIVVGAASSATYKIRFVDEEINEDGYADNNDIETQGNLIIDFSESNPFGNP
jgi:hypothetical protein